MNWLRTEHVIIIYNPHSIVERILMPYLIFQVCSSFNSSRCLESFDLTNIVLLFKFVIPYIYVFADGKKPVFTTPSGDNFQYRIISAAAGYTWYLIALVIWRLVFPLFAVIKTKLWSSSFSCLSLLHSGWLCNRIKDGDRAVLCASRGVWLRVGRSYGVGPCVLLLSFLHSWTFRWQRTVS